MAPILFADAISNNQSIKVFNYGDMQRDFTYIDDIVEGVKKVIEKPTVNKGFYKIYNIGASKTIKLLDFIEEIEKNIGEKAKKEMLPMQPGDVQQTWANIDDFKKEYNYEPSVHIKEGVYFFIKWFKEVYLNLVK